MVREAPATDVLTAGKMPDPHSPPGEVRIRVAGSGVKPGNIKKREDAFRYRGAEVTSRAMLPPIYI